MVKVGDVVHGARHRGRRERKRIALSMRRDGGRKAGELIGGRGGEAARGAPRPPAPKERDGGGQGRSARRCWMRCGGNRTAARRPAKAGYRHWHKIHPCAFGLLSQVTRMPIRTVTTRQRAGCRLSKACGTRRARPIAVCEERLDAVRRFAECASREALIRRYAALHVPADAALAEALEPVAGLEFGARSRAHLLSRFVGEAPAFPRPRSRAEALGLLYVLEGSTLSAAAPSCTPCPGRASPTRISPSSIPMVPRPARAGAASCRCWSARPRAMPSASARRFSARSAASTMPSAVLCGSPA